MRTVIIIQARMGSTRLPGKILMDIAGVPMLKHVVERVRKSIIRDKIIIATTELQEDNQVVDIARKLDVDIFRGSQNDVLDRYYQAAIYYGAETIIRITSDCPLIEPRIIDLVISRHHNSNADYTSNTMKRTFPRGWDVEAFNIDSLSKVRHLATEYHQREHVTPYFYEHQTDFKILNIEAEGKLRRPELRFCVDENDDLKLVRVVYEALGIDGNFYAEDIINLFDQQPELTKINVGVKQKVK